MKTGDADNVAAQLDRQTFFSRFSVFLSGVLDGFSIALFSLPFFGLTHLFGSLWFRFSSEE